MGIQSHAPDKVAALGALPLVVVDCLSVLVGLPHLGFRPLVVVDCLSARLLCIWVSNPLNTVWVSNPIKYGSPDKVAAPGALPLVVVDCLSVLVRLPHLRFCPPVVVDCLSARLLYANSWLWTSTHGYPTP